VTICSSSRLKEALTRLCLFARSLGLTDFFDVIVWRRLPRRRDEQETGVYSYQMRSLLVALFLVPWGDRPGWRLGRTQGPGPEVRGSKWMRRRNHCDSQGVNGDQDRLITTQQEQPCRRRALCEAYRRFAGFEPRRGAAGSAFRMICR
jgi:hypothetical protein